MTAEHYQQFADLIAAFKDQKFKVLLFPCNQFLGQEPSQPDSKSVRRMSVNKKNTGPAPTDAEFAEMFVVMDMVEVNGDKASEVFEFLKYNSELYNQQTKYVTPIPWNFGKFLIDPSGGVFKYYSPQVKPIAIKDDIAMLMGPDSPKTPTRPMVKR